MLRLGERSYFTGAPHLGQSKVWCIVTKLHSRIITADSVVRRQARILSSCAARESKTNMLSPSSTSFEKALGFVKKEGIVLESAHGRVQTFADFVAGERVTRWWSHPKGRLIFALTRAIRDSPDVLTCRLIDGKVTYIHRRLWPALVKLSGELDTSGLGAIREEPSPDGKHKTVVTEFPKWVPAEVLPESKQLTQREARSLLAPALPESPQKGTEGTK